MQKIQKKIKLLKLINNLTKMAGYEANIKQK